MLIRALRLLAALAAFLGAAQTAGAVDLRDRPVNVIVGFGPGGLGDIVTRLISARMAESLGTSFVIENLPGASGMTAAAKAARSRPDGHTILLVSAQNAASQFLFEKMPYEPASLAPVSPIGTFEYVFIVRKDSPLKTMRDLLDVAKSDPDHFNIGTISTGSAQNLAATLFLTKAGLKARVVPTRTTGEVVSALMGGQIQAAVETVPGVIGQIQGGAVRAISIFSAKPLSNLPGVPTLIESGVNFNVTSWQGIMMPAGAPKDIVSLLNSEIGKAVAAPDIREKLVKLGVTPLSGSPEDLQHIFDEDAIFWRESISAAGIAKQ